MNAVVRSAPSGMRGVDCVTPLTASHVAALKAAGYGFVIRYVRLSGNAVGWDISTAEAMDILGAGLGLGLVQHVRRPGWPGKPPSAGLGSADGIAAVQHAQAVFASANLPLSGALGLSYDMESPPLGPTAYADIVAYDEAWCDVVVRAGFVAGGYFGYGLPPELTSDRLRELRVTRYWRAGNGPNAPIGIGWCMEQQMPFNQTIAGVNVDLNVVTGDQLGRFPELAWLDP